MAYNDPYNPIQTGAAFMSGMMRSYNNNLMKQADLMKFKYQMGRQKKQDAYIAEQRENARFDRNINIATGVRNAMASGDYDLANALKAGMSGGFAGQPAQTAPDMNKAIAFSDEWMKDSQLPTKQVESTATSIPTPTFDTLGSAGVQSKIPMRIGGQQQSGAVLRNDAGDEVAMGPDGTLRKVITKTTKGPYGTTSTKRSLSPRAEIIKQEHDFKPGAKKTAGESVELITPVTSTLTNRLKKDTPDTLIPSIIDEIVETARDAVGAKTIPGYEEALLREEKLPIPDSVNRQIVNEAIKSIENSGMTEDQKDIAYDKIDSLGETNPRSIIDREAGRYLKKTGILRSITDFFGPRFPQSEIDAKSEGDVMRTYAALKEKGYIKPNGEVSEEKLDNMVTNLMAGTENPEKIVEAAVGPEGVIGFDGERLSAEEAKNSAQVRYLIKNQVRLKLDAIRDVDKSDGLIGPAVGGTYRIGKKAIKKGFELLPETKGDPQITTMPGYRTNMRF